MCRKMGVFTYVQLFYTAPLKFGRAKTSNIRRDLEQLLTLSVDISANYRNIDKR